MIPEDGEDKLTTMGDLVGSFQAGLESFRKDPNASGMANDQSQSDNVTSSYHRHKQSGFSKDLIINSPGLGVIDES